MLASGITSVVIRRSIMKCNNNKKIFPASVISVFLALFALISCSSSLHAAEWTFMVYIGADNSLSEAAPVDIEEMRKATISSNVNVIVQVEMSPNYSVVLPSYLSDFNTHRLVIRNGTVYSYNLNNNLDMANPDTLKEFIQWGASSYPANKYALIIWDHGAGWKKRSGVLTKRGAVEDATSNSFMTLSQLGTGVKNSGVYINLLNFDACLMAMYEVAYEFTGYADYLVASEETEPNAGNPYTSILNELSANPAMGARDLSQVFVSKYTESYTGGSESTTLSAIDLSQIPALHSLILDFVSAARADLSAYWSSISIARDNAQHYTYKSNTDMVSFLDYLKDAGGTVGDKAATLSSFITNSVVVASNYHSGSGGVVSGSAVSGSRGLAIFFPSSSTLQEGEMTSYAGLASNAAQENSWYSFLNDFLNFAGGGGGGSSLVLGGFAYAAAWINNSDAWGDADVDLYIIEPDGAVGSAWLGQSTPNGYFSPESSLSGKSYEIYTAKGYVMSGDYLFVVNYFNDGIYDHYANVYMLYMDYQYGINSWTFIPGTYTKTMSFSKPAPPLDQWTDSVVLNIVNGYYSDWWVPIAASRAIGGMSREQQQKIFKGIRELAGRKSAAHGLQKIFDAFKKH